MEPKVKYFRLDEIIGADLNPKDHDIGVIISSIKRFGFTSPLIRNERTKKLIAGHGRLEALIKMFKAGYSLPKNILVDDDMWLVPVITGLEFGGWDEETLLAILDTVKDDLEGVGFDESDMQSLYENIESDWEDDDTDRGLGDPRIKYRLIFDNEKQQANWFKFLEWLNNNSDVDGFPARLTEHVKGTFDE